ncbi:NRDE family protein, partial [Pseudomonas aeruginosa]
MCLIVFAWQPGHALPLLVAANRDEFYARPSLPLAAWEDAEGVFAGRDLEAGGTWLGLGPAGRFAALTNVRDPSQALGKRSRGELVADFLRGGGNPADYLAQV